MEPLMRIELTTSSLPRKCSTTELQRLLPRGRYWKTDLFHNRSALLIPSERETRLEPATYSLEGYRSTNWATPAFSIVSDVDLASRTDLWAGVDSNLWSRKTADLQSAPFGRSGTCPTDGVSTMLRQYWATCRNRTNDLLITNQLLYQLS